MKKKTSFYINGTRYEKQINYIPFRYIAAIVFALLETLAVITIVMLLSKFVPYFYIAVLLTEIGVVIHIVSADENPDFKIPWLLFVLILPVVGFMLYFLFSQRKLDKKYRKKLTVLRSINYTHNDTENFADLHKADVSAYRSANLLCGISDTHLFKNTAVEYFPLGENYKDSLLADLKKAKDFIFLEYFIIEEGVFWNSILEILKSKVKEGVEVRVLYDDIGCMMTLPGNYVKTLRAYGIKAAVFSKLRGNADSEFNNRSHRKIAVIDGKIAYTGGINLADEYINAIEKHGHWKDGGIRLCGDAASELTKLFLTDYGINTKEIEQASDKYFPLIGTENTDGYVVPFGDGPKPVYTRRVGKTIIQNLIENAKNYVYVTTPYLIIDNELCMTIENAALRGVKIKIVVPHIPDKKIIFAMTRSYYHRLMAAGVEIYEYTPGFIHAKTYLADDKFCIVGTINLDYRSLVHHFENGVWMYDCRCLSEIKDDIEATLSKSMPVSGEQLKTGIFRRFFNSLVKIFSPLL